MPDNPIIDPADLCAGKCICGYAGMDFRRLNGPDFYLGTRWPLAEGADVPGAPIFIELIMCPKCGTVKGEVEP